MVRLKLTMSVFCSRQKMDTLSLSKGEESMNLISTAYAQDAQASAPSGGALGMFLPLILVFVIFYLLIFRPQQKQMKVRKQMLAELKRGDEIILNGGLVGKITDLQDNFIMLQIANNVVVKADRAQVNSVMGPQNLKP